MIEIKTEKVIQDGKRSIKITDFKALSKEELPNEYINSGPAVYEADGFLIILTDEPENFVPFMGLAELMALSLSKGFAIHKGQIVSLDFWNAICKAIGEAGLRLKKVKQEMLKDKTNWKGEKVYKW